MSVLSRGIRAKIFFFCCSTHYTRIWISGLGDIAWSVIFWGILKWSDPLVEKKCSNAYRIKSENNCLTCWNGLTPGVPIPCDGEMKNRYLVRLRALVNIYFYINPISTKKNLSCWSHTYFDNISAVRPFSKMKMTKNPNNNIKINPQHMLPNSVLLRSLGIVCYVEYFSDDGGQYNVLLVHINNN